MTTSSTRSGSLEQNISINVNVMAPVVRQQQKQTIAIAATFTCDPIEESLAYWMQELSIPSTIAFAPYNQVFQQLLDPTGTFASNKQGVNAILLRFEDCYRYETETGQDEIVEAKLEKYVNTLVRIVESVAGQTSTPFLIFICPASPQVATNPRRQTFFTHLEDRLAVDLAEISGVYLIQSTEILTTYPVSLAYDAYGDTVGHMPFTPVFFAALGTLIARKMYALRSTPYKVIALDCDQTLWQGICGEDGAAGVVIDPIRMQLQEFLVAQQKAGMLLCLCSKNNEQDVCEVFANHPEMPLKREHVVASRVNWQPKSENLRSLAEELHLSLESFIFIDDSQMECAEVEANCPEVLTLPLPAELNRWPRLLQHFWAFDHIKITDEDTKRTDLYRQQMQRQMVQQVSPTLASFLTSLDVHVSIAPLEKAQLSRVAQLTQRTNQFNCTTIRRTESEIQQFCVEDNGNRGECLTVEVSDRFGDYGLVGVILFTTTSQEIEVDTFLLSCRVLGRGVEHQLLAKLGEIARERGVSRVHVPYVSTAKNVTARAFLEGSGAVSIQTHNDRWVFDFPTETLGGFQYTPASGQPEVFDVEQRTRVASFVDAENLMVAPVSAQRTGLSLLRIATEFNTARQVLEVIATQRYQHLDRLDSDEPVALPRTDIEKQLVEIWAEVLKVAQVSIHDDFFELGGSSLLAVKISSRLYSILQVDVPLRSYFEAPTIAQFAEVIEQIKEVPVESGMSGTQDSIASSKTRYTSGDRRRDATVLAQRQTEEIVSPVRKHDGWAHQAISMFPASLTQQRLWFLDQMEPHNAAYNLPTFLRLHIPIDVSILEQSINALIQRHEILRTTFLSVDGQPMQVIAPVLALPLQVEDLRHVADAEREVAMLQLATEEVRRPFDLTQGSLLRSLLLQLGAEEYMLVLTMHHIIFDGWSTGILFQELASLYTAFASGHTSPLPELPIQYTDFALWQHEQLPGEAFEQQLTYWQQHLANAPALLELSAGRSPTTVSSYEGATYCTRLPRELSEALKRLGRQERVSLYMLLVATLQTLLFRYTGQDDILIGTVSAGRTQTEIEALIGFFVNTLVLRTDLSGNPSFRELLVRVREEVFEAYAHQDIPFEILVKELKPTRSLNLNPFFQVMLSLSPALPSLLPGWEPDRLAVETGAARFALTLDVEDTPDGLVNRFEYRTDVFDAATIAHMAGHWQTLLEAIVANPDQHLAQLPLLTEPERQQLLVEWNDTATAYPQDVCLHQLLEAQVERTPDAVAVVFEGESLTYRQLDRKANQLAHYLQSQGVGPDVLVGVCMERSLEMVVSLLGILKAGGAYVPLDPTYPYERLVFMLQDARMSILLTQERFKVNLVQHVAQVICVDGVNAERVATEEQEVNTPVSEVRPDHLAYMIYTSGSTGKPKGAMNTHRGICNRLLWMQDAYQLQMGESVLQKTPFSFDVSVWEFFWPLMVGAKLVVARPDGHRDSAYLKQLIEEQQITTLHFVPSMLRIFLDEPGVEECKSLKRVICSGEALAYELQQRFFECLGAELHNLYGPTEAAVDVTYWACERDGTRRFVPIGRPIANTDLYVMDTNFKPVPIGVPGELYIGGVGVGRGYFNRPELTNERFIPHPFSDLPNARLYKTGDLVRYLPDGNIEYLGRLDHQIKIRGLRIELGEIEAVLDQYPAVREVVVVAHDDITGDKSLIAYISLHNGQTATISDLHTHMKAQLPAYMLPSTIMLLPALPLLPNGKVDRNALPAPEANRSMTEGAFVAPKTMVQRQLAQLWEELLDVRPVGIRDNFFYLGGHSLLAARLVNRIQQTFGKKLSLSALFAGPTIEQLALALQLHEEDHTRIAMVRIQTGGEKRPLFYLHGAYRGDGFYSFPLAHELEPDQPFYALGSFQFDEQPIPPTLEEIATAYIELIRTVQPEGPYQLGGFCNGGLIVYEMARQLVALEQKVDLLVLIDPTIIGHHRKTRQIIKRAGKMLHLSQKRQVDVFLWLRHMYNYLRHDYRYVRFPHYRKLATDLNPEWRKQKDGVILKWNALYELEQSRETFSSLDEQPAESRHRESLLKAVRSKLAALFPDPIFPTKQVLHQDWEGLFFWATAEYEPALYPDRSTFFFSWASGMPYRQQWLDIAEAKDAEVELHFITGNHETCKTEYLSDLAAHVRMCLKKVEVSTRHEEEQVAHAL